MSKIFLGVSFFVCGLLLLLMLMLVHGASNVPALHLCSGALLGAGGIMVVWHLSDHLAAAKTTHLTGK
jgi:hypothetical protein